MQDMTKENARKLAHDVFNTSVFECNGYHAKTTAQRNLNGKTHYVDDDTLRYHKSRILDCYDVNHGTLFALIESCALDMYNTRRGFRFVVFDLAGQTLGRASLEETFKSNKAATAAMWDWLNDFDVVTHYKDKLRDEIRRDENRIAEMQKIIEMLN